VARDGHSSAASDASAIAPTTIAVTTRGIRGRKSSPTLSVTLVA
jgi:hypothetical protein